MCSQLKTSFSLILWWALEHELHYRVSPIFRQGASLPQPHVSHSFSVVVPQGMRGHNVLGSKGISPGKGTALSC